MSKPKTTKGTVIEINHQPFLVPPSKVTAIIGILASITPVRRLNPDERHFGHNDWMKTFVIDDSEKLEIEVRLQSTIYNHPPLLALPMNAIAREANGSPRLR